MEMEQKREGVIPECEFLWAAVFRAVCYRETIFSIS